MVHQHAQHMSGTERPQGVTAAALNALPRDRGFHGPSGLQKAQPETQNASVLELEAPSKGYFIHPPAFPSAQTADSLFLFQTPSEKIRKLSLT